MKTVGENFEEVFNKYFNNQQEFKHKIELLKSINNDWNSQNLNNLFNNVSITQIMIDICKSLSINLNYLIGTESNMFTYEKENFMNENVLKDTLIYKVQSIQNTPILNIVKINDVFKFQTNSINLFFLSNKNYIVIMKGGLSGIASISQHIKQDKFFVKFNDYKDDYFVVDKKDIEVIAEELNND